MSEQPLHRDNDGLDEYREPIDPRDVRVGVEQPDGSMHWLSGEQVGVTGTFQKHPTAAPTYEVEWCEVTHPIECNTVAITYVCELGEHCRCHEGDEPGCWNWIGKGGL